MTNDIDLAQRMYDRLEKKYKGKYSLNGYRQYVSDTDKAYSIPLTAKQVHNFGLMASSDIPSSQTRIAFRKREFAKELLCLDKRRPVKTYYKEGDEIAFVTSYNLGTKKWADITISVDFGRVVKVTEKMIETTYGRISKDFVLGKLRRS